jgi:serine protease inhibitor
MHKPARLAATTLLLLVACSEGSDPLGPPIQLSTGQRQLVDASAGFGFDVYRALSADSGATNLFISPLSISMALGMTMNGAANQTLAQMRSVMGFQELSEAAVNEGYQAVIPQLVRRDSRVDITIANSMWPIAELPVQPAFTSALRTFFNAEVRPLPLGSDPVQAINQWTEHATRGRIKKLFEQLEPNTRMVLVNAIYFKAPWTDQFKVTDTRVEPFTRADGSTVTVPIMSRTGSYTFRRDADLIAVEAPYANEAFSMVLVRPASGSLSALEARLNPEWWSSLIASMQEGRISLRMPKFKIEYGKKLNDLLIELGMVDAFDAALADFSRITGGPGLYISQVQHKAFVEVNEQGTEAAAATGVALPDSAPPDVSFDQPFLFAIRERESGVILFIGKVGDPTAG